jgi:O-antigen ligase
LQISTVLWEAPNWGRGFFNPYSSIEFYLFELLILISSLLFFAYKLRRKKAIKVGYISYYALILGWWFLVLFSLAYHGVTPSYALGITAHSGVFILLYFLIVNRIAPVRTLIIALVATMSLQSGLAIFQFLSQSSLGLSFLGEPNLSLNAANLAKMNIGGAELIRAYGTLPHPNVLGGFLSLSMIGTFVLSIKTRWLKPTLLLLQFFGLLFSFSRSALTSLTMALVLMAVLYRKDIKLKSKTLINGAIFFVIIELVAVVWLRFNELSQSAGIRLQGFKDAVTMFDTHPLGVGFQSYTLNLDLVSNIALMPWEYQPVHNIYLLMLAELGVFGLLLGTWFFLFAILKLHEKRKHWLTKQRKQKKLLLLCSILIIALIGFFDHYWISLNQGMALLTFFFALASAFSLDPTHVVAIKKGATLKRTPIDPTENL